MRRPGAGRPRKDADSPELLTELDLLIDPTTRGDLESPLRWTTKSTRKLAKELTDIGYPVSRATVAQLLVSMNYSLQSPQKQLEGKQHPDRNAQFEYINEQTLNFHAHGLPVISVDTKKKELVGDFRKDGREWTPTIGMVTGTTQ